MVSEETNKMIIIRIIDQQMGIKNNSLFGSQVRIFRPTFCFDMSLSTKMGTYRYLARNADECDIVSESDGNTIGHSLLLLERTAFHKLCGRSSIIRYSIFGNDLLLEALRETA